MSSPNAFDSYYRQFVSTISDLRSEDIIEVNLAFLIELDLFQDAATDSTHSLSPTFNVIEEKEKTTLFNEEFLIWIIPAKNGNITHTVICRWTAEGPILEVVLMHQGAFNLLRLVFQTLQKMLFEIKDNENLISSFE